MGFEIPFVTSRSDLEYLHKYQPNAAAVRVSLQNASNIINPNFNCKVWIDANVDCLHSGKLSNTWQDYVDGFRDLLLLSDPSFIKRADKQITTRLVNELLDRCLEYDPDWLSVPQLPLVNDVSRNKINRALATATAKWSRKRAFRGKLVLPVIITNQKQANLKTKRTPKIKVIVDCFLKSTANVVWIVDASLSDDSGSSTLERKRLPGIIAFHRELGNLLPEPQLTIAGPYWTLNLVLWVRGLASNPAIGLGKGYRYFIPGSVMHPSQTRIAIPPLRRLMIASSAAQSWLYDASLAIPSNQKEHKELRELYNQFARLTHIEGASKHQIARFYGKWIDSIESVAASGRAFALYQQLSSAYVLGKGLPDMPPEERTARRPHAIAKQHMLMCL